MPQDIPSAEPPPIPPQPPSRAAWQAEVLGIELPPGEEPAPVQMPPPGVSVAPDGHIRRPLPKVHSPSHRFRRAAAAPEIPPEEVKARLTQLNKTVLDRLKFVMEYFSGEKVAEGVDPTKSPDFLSFVRDHLAYLNMAYVVNGQLPAGSHASPFPEEEEEEPQPDSATGDIPAHPGQATEPKLDPALAAHPAVLEAMEAGVDLTGDSGEFSDDLV